MATAIYVLFSIYGLTVFGLTLAANIDECFF